MLQRIVVLGTSGSGKTTLARELARRFGVPTLELDAVHWQANWTPTPAEQMTPVVQRFVAQPAWTVDGNYSKLRHLILDRTDTIIWLDYSLAVVFGRVVRRTLRRCWTQEELWNGNRENLWTQLTSRDSIFLWVLTTWRKRRQEYRTLLKEQRRLGRRVLHFRTPAKTARWLKDLPTSPSLLTPTTSPPAAIPRTVSSLLRH